MTETEGLAENPGELAESAEAIVGGDAQEQTESIAAPSRAERWKPLLKKLAWCWFALFCLSVFTILKLPEDRLQNYIQGMISSQLASQGVTMTAAHSALSYGFGISYTMRDITLNMPPSAEQAPIKIDEISVSPSILSALMMKAGVSIKVENKGGLIKATFSQSFSQTGNMTLDFSSSKLDLGALGALPLLANIKGSAVLDGSGQITGSMSDPSGMTGAIELDLSKIVIDQQNVVGFSVPRLTISEGKIDTKIEQGKVKINTFSVGKTGSSTDDLIGRVTGDITLGKNLMFSTLNLKASFTLSQAVLKAFILLDAILGPGKQPDGSYAFTITGPLSAPNPAPVLPGAH